ncbi:hypothetical protein BDI4_40068 [Burkholderia diffusa]|nr:hypothetical protein BDI4_40068 [Burkholderia diffusa]
MQRLKVDLQNEIIRVAEALVRGEHKDRTKTAVARTVRLKSRALAVQHQLGRRARIPAKFLDADSETARNALPPAYNMRHRYATAMLMAGMTSAFCAKQLGYSIGMFLTTYAKWMDSEQNALDRGYVFGRMELQHHARSLDVRCREPVLPVVGPQDHDRPLLVAGPVHVLHDRMLVAVDRDHRHSVLFSAVRALHAVAEMGNFKSCAIFSDRKGARRYDAMKVASRELAPLASPQFPTISKPAHEDTRFAAIHG